MVLNLWVVGLVPTSRFGRARPPLKKRNSYCKMLQLGRKTKKLKRMDLSLQKPSPGKPLKQWDEAENLSANLFDVTVPLCFLVNDSGQLKLHQGVKKSGIMGFCDPCPGELKALFVEYTYHGHEHKVVIDDYDELLIPRGAYRI